MWFQQPFSYFLRATPTLTQLGYGGTCLGRMAIYATQRKGDGWTRPAMLVSSQYGVGEPTLTADGRSLYFAQLFKDGKRHNMDVMVTARK